MKEIYIHFGNPKYEKEKFIEIKNRDFVKSYGGLWASPLNAKYGWKKFCEDNLISKIGVSNYFLFKLKDEAKVLKITRAEQLHNLPLNNSASKIFKDIFIALDFEEIKKEYDAIEVLISEDDQLYWDLYGWDYDSLLVLNKDVIKEMNENEIEGSTNCLFS